jgi:hypothetical protein
MQVEMVEQPGTSGSNRQTMAATKETTVCGEMPKSARVLRMVNRLLNRLENLDDLQL